jgi:hypothetical protein
VDIRITCIVQFLNLANKIKGNFPKRTLVWAPTTQGSIQSAEARDSLSLLSGFQKLPCSEGRKRKKKGFWLPFWSPSFSQKATPLDQAHLKGCRRVTNPRPPPTAQKSI